MATETVENQLELIKAQLDEIQAGLELRNRRMAELEELKDDLSGIMKDVMNSAIVELDDVSPFLQSGDMMALFKKLLRSTNHISLLLEKLEGAEDFVADVQPIGTDLFNRFIYKLDELERKGYFRATSELQSTLDALMKLLAEKRILAAAERSLEVLAETDYDQFEKVSFWKMYRLTRSPEVRQLMGVCMVLLTTFAEEMSRGKDGIAES